MSWSQQIENGERSFLILMSTKLRIASILLWIGIQMTSHELAKVMDDSRSGRERTNTGSEYQYTSFPLYFHFITPIASSQAGTGM